jgi:hypothetical protein
VLRDATAMFKGFTYEEEGYATLAAKFPPAARYVPPGGWDRLWHAGMYSGAEGALLKPPLLGAPGPKAPKAESSASARAEVSPLFAYFGYGAEVFTALSDQVKRSPIFLDGGLWSRRDERWGWTVAGVKRSKDELCPHPYALFRDTVPFATEKDIKFDCGWYDVTNFEADPGEFSVVAGKGGAIAEEWYPAFIGKWARGWKDAPPASAKMPENWKETWERCLAARGRSAGPPEDFGDVVATDPQVGSFDGVAPPILLALRLFLT